MKKARHSNEQIALALKQAEKGAPVAEVIRRMGISEQTFYRWKKVYGALGVGELRRLKPLERPLKKVTLLIFWMERGGENIFCFRQRSGEFRFCDDN